MEILIVFAGVGGAFMGAWQLSPLWRQDQDRTLVVAAMWVAVLILAATVAHYVVGAHP